MMYLVTQKKKNEWFLGLVPTGRNGGRNDEIDIAPRQRKDILVALLREAVSKHMPSQI